MKKCWTYLYALGRTTFLITAACLAVARGDATPVILRQPKSSVISQHAPVTIYCEVAPPDANVNWLFNGKALRTDEHQGLRFRGTNLHFEEFVYKTNEGIYECVASTAEGSVISEKLVVQEPVLNYFSSQADLDIWAAVDGAVVIPCPSLLAVFNDVRVHVQDSNGTILSKKTDEYVQLPSGSVLITRVQEKHAGEYRCVAVNSRTHTNQTTSHVIILHIQSQASSWEAVIVDTSDQKLFPWLGENALLECPLAYHTSPNVSWTKYGGTLPEDRARVENGNLWIDRVEIEDAGSYLCRTSSKQKVIFLEVQELVSATAVTEDILSPAGEGVELQCNVRGRPEPKVTWYHNSQPISRPSGSNSGGSVFSINKVAPSHSGFYQCQARNNISSASATMRLEVKGHGLAPLGKTEETTISVTEQGQGGNNETTDENVMKVETKPKRRKRPGRHRKHKKRREKGKKKKKKKPRKGNGGKRKTKVPPSRPDVTQLSDASVMLNWTVPQNNGLQIVFFRVQYKQVKPIKDDWRTEDTDIHKDTTKYEVKELKAGGIYKFRIAAVYSNDDNEVGPTSHRFQLSVAPPGRTRPPVDRPTIVEAEPLRKKEDGTDVFGMGIRWQYLMSEASPIEGFFIHYKPYDSKEQWKTVTILETKVRRHVLGDLKSDTEYSIRMQSFNSAGNSEFSNTVVKRTQALEKSSVLPPFLPNNPTMDNNPPTGRPVVDPQEPERTTRAPDISNVPGKSDTQRNSEMLYTILGIVLGVMLLILIIFMFMCWWKQRQQRMMALNGAIHAKFQDQAQRIYSESMRKKYMNGYPLNGLNGLVANGHVPHGSGNHANKMNINVNPMSEMEAQRTPMLVPNGSAPHCSISDNNFNSINTSKSLDQAPPDQPLLSDQSRVTDPRHADPSLQRSGQSSSHHRHLPNRGHSSNEADLSSGETNSQTSPAAVGAAGVGFEYYSSPNERPRQLFKGGTSPPVFSVRSNMDSLSPSDHVSGNIAKHKRRRKRPHSREHTMKDQATNTDLSSNEGTIEFTTFNKSPSLSSEKSQSFTNCAATQCNNYSHTDGDL